MLLTVVGQDLWQGTAQGTQHGPASVDHLQLTVPPEGLWVSGQTSGIPTIVTSELTGQVSGGITGQGAQELGTVWGGGRGKQEGGLVGSRRK